MCVWGGVYLIMCSHDSFQGCFVVNFTGKQVNELRYVRLIKIAGLLESIDIIWNCANLLKRLLAGNKPVSKLMDFPLGGDTQAIRYGLVHNCFKIIPLSGSLCSETYSFYSPIKLVYCFNFIF